MTNEQRIKNSLSKLLTASRLTREAIKEVRDALRRIDAEKEPVNRARVNQG